MVKDRPTFEIGQSEDGGYVIVVTWPKGPEQQLDGFASVEAARAWIEDHGPSWIASSPDLHLDEIEAGPEDVRVGAVEK
jgi:hypothetical protein